MSLILSNAAQLSNNSIYLTSSSNQTAFATVSVSPANSFLARYNINQTGQSNFNQLSWGDSSNVQYLIRLDQFASNISLYSGSNMLLSSNTYPLVPASDNLIALRQTLTTLGLYINDNLQFSYPLVSEVNSTGGSFQFSATSSNGSNIISSVQIDPAFSVSNAAEFL
jgi:hypothetical protein